MKLSKSFRCDFTFYLFLGLLLLVVSLPLPISTQASLPTASSEDRLQFEHITREDGLPSNEVSSVFQDSRGIMWFGTGGGLASYDGYAIKVFKNDPNDPKSLSSNIITTLYEDRQGILWVGTMGGLIKMAFSGAEKFETPKISIHRYTIKDGLPDNLIAGILEDDSGQLWISTANGLSLFRNPSHKQSEAPDFKNYDLKDGMQGYEFYTNAFFKNAAGELFFGGWRGLNIFHPDSIRDNSFLPPVVITSFEAFDLDAPDLGVVPVIGISEKQEIRLSYKNNIFSIGFAALNYRDGHLNKYAYQLEGFNDHWIPLGTDHRVTFTNLDPGTYTFRVKGSNNDGIWNETPTELKIIITPPWWKTNWAYFLYALAFLLAVYFWRRYDLNRRQLKHDLEIRQLEAEKLKEVDALKSRFFANISHDFRTPLTLILGPLEELIAQSPKANLWQFRLMQRSAQGLLRLINQLLDISKLESGKMSLEARCDDIIPVVKGAFCAFESLAKRKGIKQQFDTSLETALLYFDEDKMEQIITNVLSNAFKFTEEGGTVTVEVKELHSEHSTSFLQITISDTGTGIAADQLPYVFDRFYQSPDGYAKVRQGSGIGLALTKELVELHHGQIQVNSEVSRGTQFTLLFPFGKAHLQADEIVEQTLKAPVFKPNISGALPIPDLRGSSISPTDEKAIEKAIVLLVEDNDDMRAFIHRQLAGHYQIVEAADGQEGLEKALEIIPDLIISDVMMPRMNGLQLCDTLKNDVRTSHIPIILLTSKADIEFRLVGLERGADAYLAKPFNREELLLRSRKLLELRDRLRARYASLPPPPVAEKDIQIEDAFLQKIRQLVEQNLSDQNLDMDHLSQVLGMSRSQVYRKVKALTGLSPTVYIRSIRLQQAKVLLETTELSISEVAYQVGFSTPTYFSDAFLEVFGIRPSEVRK